MKFGKLLCLTCVLILSSAKLFSQGFVFRQELADDSGNFIFTGGYSERTLISFVDIDDDNDEDMFFIASSNGSKLSIHYFENIGSKTEPKYKFITNRYSPYDYYKSGFNIYYPVIQFADIDGDHDLDLIMGFGNELRLYRNSGNSSKASFDWDKFEVILTAGDCTSTRCYCNYPTFVDIDNDGDLDLFLVYNTIDITYSSPTIRFYRNIGDKNTFNFRLENENFLNGIFPIGNLCFYDIDHDSDYDLFFCGKKNGELETNLFFFENTGNSNNYNFQLRSDSLLIPNYFRSSYPKYISIVEDDQIKRILLGFTEGPVHSFRWTVEDNLSKVEFENNFFPDIDVGYNSFPQFVDIDNDGDYDLFACGGIIPITSDQGPGRTINFFENTGDKFNSKFEYRLSMYDTINNVSQFKFGDIDNDGDYDLLIGGTDRDRKVKLYLNIGTKDSASFKLNDTVFIKLNTLNGNFPSPLLLDIDGDSDLDLLVSFRAVVADGSKVFLYRNDGDKFSPKWNLYSQNYFNFPRGAYDAWDYDNDGDLDLVVTDSLITIIENTGCKDSAIFKIRDNINDIRLIGGFGAAALVDIDSDGDKDIFIGNSQGGILFYRNDTPTNVLQGDKNTNYDFQLLQNYPNPFNPETTISFSLNEASYIELTIYNNLGQKVKQIISQYLPAGKHQYKWNGKDQNGNSLATGIYIIQLQGTDQKLLKKALLLK